MYIEIRLYMNFILKYLKLDIQFPFPIKKSYTKLITLGVLFLNRFQEENEPKYSMRTTDGYFTRCFKNKNLLFL
jgi:hypothetical protein